MRKLIFILLAMIGVSQAQTIQYIGAPTTTVISRGNFRTDSIFYLPKRSKAPTDTAAFRYQISDSSLYVWTGSQWIKAGGSGTISGSGITGYLPQFSASTTLDTSALFTLGNRLGIGSSTFAYTSTNTANIELNGTAGGILGFKRNDSAKGYLFHNGDNMELANTMAGSISFNTNSATRGSIASDGVWRLHNLAGTGDRVVQASSNGTLSATASVTGLVDTLTISTRAWRQKGIDSVVSIIPAAGVGGSGTTNYVPKFTAGTTIGNSQIFDNGTSVGIGTASPNASYLVEAVKNGDVIFNLRTTSATGNPYIRAQSTTTNVYSAGIAQSTGTSAPFVNDGAFQYTNGAGGMQIITGTATPIQYFTNNTERLRIFANGRVFIGASPTDAGYQLDINGTLRSVNGANFATTSGNVGIGTASPSAKFDVDGVARITGSGSAPSTGEGIEFQYAANQGEVLTYNRTGAAYTPLRVRSSTIKLYGGGGAGGIDIATSGNVGIGTASPVGDGTALNIYGSSFATIKLQNSTSGATATDGTDILVASSDLLIKNRESGSIITYTANTERGRINSAGEWIIDASGTDAGDYKLQVVGNARIGTGKLDIASNTTFGLGVARSGTSEVAGQIYNSNGILYLGAESSAGGQIFSGSSAYAAVIGSGANYPLQFATNNATRATINTNGEMLINTTTDNGDFKLQVNGNGYITGNLQINPSANTTGIYMPSMSWTGSNASAAVNVSGTLNTTGAPSLIYVDVSDVASGTETNFMQFVNSDTKFRVTKQGDIQTAAPSGGTARKWKLGSVVATSVQLDTNNYVEVEINGTFYRLAIVTPL